MSYSNGPALGNLPLKQLDYAPATAHDTSKSNRSPPHASGLSRNLHEHFADSLRSPHHTDGIHSLNRGNKDKPFGAETRNHIEQVLGPHHIFQDGFTWIQLHEGDLIVSSGVKDHLWSEGLADAL